MTLFAKANALVAGVDAWDALSDENRRILGDAAAATRKWAIDTAPTDAASAATFCTEGGTIAKASAAQVDALRAATSHVMAELKRHATVADTISQIERLKARHPDPDPVVSCDSAATTGTAIDGSFTLEVLRADFEQRGVTDESLIGQNLGEFEWTFESGEYRYEQLTPEGESISGSGDYTLDGDTFTLYWSHEPGQFSAATVSRDPDGALRFSDVTDGAGAEFQPVAEALFGAHPFVPVSG